jgi:hypothetical protein
MMGVGVLSNVKVKDKDKMKTYMEQGLSDWISKGILQSTILPRIAFLKSSDNLRLY